MSGTGLPAAAASGIEAYLTHAESVILPALDDGAPDGSSPPLAAPPEGRLLVGVDLGTAYVVLVVLDENGRPLAGEYQFAQVVRDGLVVDFIGAIDLLRGMKQRVERRLGRELAQAASAFPPGVPRAEVRATANVVEAAGMRCTGLIDEPSAANHVLGLRTAPSWTWAAGRPGSPWSRRPGSLHR